MKEDAYVIQAESQQPIKIEFEGPVINRVDISFPEPVLVWHNTDPGFSEFVLKWGDDGKLHADTEFLDRGDDKRFTESILKLLVSEIIIDE